MPTGYCHPRYLRAKQHGQGGLQDSPCLRPFLQVSALAAPHGHDIAHRPTLSSSGGVAMKALASVRLPYDPFAAPGLSILCTRSFAAPGLLSAMGSVDCRRLYFGLFQILCEGFAAPLASFPKHNRVGIGFLQITGMPPSKIVQSVLPGPGNLELGQHVAQKLRGAILRDTVEDNAP
jgi:hypothetical protein